MFWVIALSGRCSIERTRGALRIDKGFRAVRCVIVRSGGTILSTVILEISPESSYFSPSYDIEYNIFGLELWKLRI